MIKPRLAPAALYPALTSEQVARTIANNIRAELVCCNAYDRYSESEEAEALGHGLCYWGEAAARLAESTI